MKFSKKALYSAGVVFLIGAGTTVKSLQYSIGTAERLGPGAFPLMIGVLLLLLAVFILFESRADDPTMAEDSLSAQARGWGLVCAGAVLFIVLGKHGGLVPATFASVFVASLGDRGNTLVSALKLALVVTIFAVAVFHYGLKMPIPLLTWW